MILLVYCSIFIKLFVLHITDCSTPDVPGDEDVIDFKVEPVEVSDCI